MLRRKGNLRQGGLSLDITDQSLIPGQAEELSEDRIAEVKVNQNRFLFHQGKRGGDVDGAVGFPLIGKGGRHGDHRGFPIGGDQAQLAPDGPVKFAGRTIGFVENQGGTVVHLLIAVDIAQNGQRGDRPDILLRIDNIAEVILQV